MPDRSTRYSGYTQRPCISQCFSFRHSPFMGNRLTTTTPDYEGCVVNLVPVSSTHPLIFPSLHSPSTTDFFPSIVCKIPSTFFFLNLVDCFNSISLAIYIGYFILRKFFNLKSWRAEFEKWPFFIWRNCQIETPFAACCLNLTINSIKIYTTLGYFPDLFARAAVIFVNVRFQNLIEKLQNSIWPLLEITPSYVTAPTVYTNMIFVLVRRLISA